MKTIMVLCFMLISTLSYANETITRTPQYFLQVGYDITVTLPCNWDKKFANITVFGYYGQGTGDLYQDVIIPLKIEPFGQNLLLSFDPQSLMAHTGNAKALHHLDIDFKVTSKKCGFGFDTGMLTK